MRLFFRHSWANSEFVTQIAPEKTDGTNKKEADNANTTSDDDSAQISPNRHVITQAIRNFISNDRIDRRYGR